MKVNDIGSQHADYILANFVAEFSTIFGVVYFVFVQNSIRRVSMVKMLWGGRRIIKGRCTLLHRGPIAEDLRHCHDRDTHA